MTTADNTQKVVENDNADVPGFTPETLNVHPDLSAFAEPEASWPFDEFEVTAQRGRDALWIVVRRHGRGGIALRTFPIMGAYTLRELAKTGTGGQWQVDTHSGRYIVTLDLTDTVLRMTTRFTPSRDILVAFWPRDLYVLDADDDPTCAKGQVEAAQRGLNGGYCYLCLKEPAFGSVLYMQNLTALNDFFVATKTKPDGVVGGQWPELGYQPPTAPLAMHPPVNPLKKGQEVTISDALMVLRTECPGNEFDSAKAFVEMLGTMYPKLDKPKTDLHDWLWRADKTLRDLKTSPKATVKVGGHPYIFPYTDSEYPDSMVQMSVTSTLWEYEKRFGVKERFSEALGGGVRGFFDVKLRTLRRYLSNVGADKNADAVDSWYLYHPLMNLARLAINGEEWAKTLFFDGLEFVIKVAQHFKYKWPIIYDLTDFSVICQSRDEEGLGQTDVGGIYAYVMLQAHQLSGDRRYIDEAKKALKAAENYRFELAYQTNLNAWGATACLKLWKLDGDQRHLDQSLTFVASFLHNCELWNSELEHASSYANFFGVTCLHDGPYMAAYEAFECFMAFDEYLQGGDDIPHPVRLLLAEYWRNALDVLWGFYPDALPEGALAQEIRNGHIDRDLSFPLEDLYGDGGPAGQVGQEIYGAGAAFVIASRAYRECPGAPFRLFAEYPTQVECTDGTMSVKLLGPAGYTARLRLIAIGSDLGKVTFLTEEHNELDACARETTFIEYEVKADGRYTAAWSLQ